MKKWLIIAAVVAMFAMVFPACGKDEGGDPSASEVNAKVYTSGILITWTAPDGYDFALYFQEKADLTKISGGTDISPGQNLYAYKENDDGDDVEEVLNDSKDQWAVFINSDWTTAHAAFKTLVDGKIGRFGVGAANPGGFPLESVKIQWDNEDEKDGDDVLKEKGFLADALTLP